MASFISMLVRAPIAALAKELSGDIAKRYPPKLDHDASKRPSVNRLTRVVEDVCSKAKRFQVEHRLGWIGKAALGNSFRWELTELGYREEFVDFATEALVVHISKADDSTKDVRKP